MSAFSKPVAHPGESTIIPGETPELEARTIRKVTARLIPFLIVCYFVAYLDRVNVGFAALTMNQDLGLTASMYGFGAGVFFLAYFVFEVPSNLFLDRFGARKWIARIMFTWGVLSGLMAFIPRLSAYSGLRNEQVFYSLRVLLGIAEAGFFPGIIFYLTLWFPAVYRARIISAFMAAIPLSSVIGAPVSGLLLEMHGWAGMAGWQWLFIIEATPAVILSVVTCFRYWSFMAITTRVISPWLGSIKVFPRFCSNRNLTYKTVNRL